MWNEKKWMEIGHPSHESLVCGTAQKRRGRIILLSPFHILRTNNPLFLISPFLNAQNKNYSSSSSSTTVRRSRQYESVVRAFQCARRDQGCPLCPPLCPRGCWCWRRWLWARWGGGQDGAGRIRRAAEAGIWIEEVYALYLHDQIAWTKLWLWYWMTVIQHSLVALNRFNSVSYAYL